MLDYCLHQGSENVVIYFRDNIYIIKTLKEFQYIDEDGKDQGANVRQKAKDITNLLQDESRLREERRSRAHMRDRMARGTGSDDRDENKSRRTPENFSAGPLTGKRPNRDEDELRKAIEESKRTLAAERAAAEERELQAALRASKEEEDKRQKGVEDTNASALFDDANQLYVHCNSSFARWLTHSCALQAEPFVIVDSQFPTHRDRPNPLRRRTSATVHNAATVHGCAAPVYLL